MKKLICTLTLGAGLLLGLSGCDLYQPDVDSLLTPPVLSELQTEVDEALRDVVGQELRLCYPAGGSYRSGVKDIFGHRYLSGVGKRLEEIVSREIGCKVRSIELNVMQRCAAHIASKTDLEESEAIAAARPCR